MKSFGSLHNSKVKANLLLILIYSLVFVPTAFIVFYYFIKTDKSFITLSDSMSQHLACMHYLCELIRGFLTHPALNLPMWSWNMGYGADILTTLAYYVLDPVSMIAALFPPIYAEYAYILLIILQFYLAGISFIIFCRFMKKRFLPTLIGSLMYAYMGFMVYSMIHPNFLDPVIFLPLLILGVEKILTKRKPFLFIIMVSISAASNFYFFYMLSIIFSLYALVRFFDLYNKHHLLNFFKLLVKFICYFLLGILMSAAIFIPVVAAMMDSTRTIKEIYPIFVYPFRYYASEFMGFGSAVSIGFWTITSFAFVAFLFIPLFIIRWKKSQTFSSLFIIMTIMTLFPVFGYVLNGMAYVSNRWMFAYGFVVCFLTINILSEKHDFSFKEKITMLMMACIFIAGIILSYNYLKISLFETLFIAIATALLLIFGKNLSNYLTGRSRSVFMKFVSSNSFEILLLFIVIVNLGIISYDTFNNENSLYTKSPVRFGTVNEIYKTQGAILNNIKDTDFFRVTKTYSASGSNISNYNSNDSLIQHYNGTQAFYSLLPKSLFDRYSELNLRTLRFEQIYGDNDNRVALEALTSVRYMAIKNGDEGYVPFGFVKTASEGNYELYKNKYSLPVGFVYDKYMTHTQFLNYSPLQRQQILLQGIVIDKLPSGMGDSITEVTPAPDIIKLNYKIINTKDLTIKGKTIEVTKKGGSIIISPYASSNSELYVDLRNIQMIKTYNPMDHITQLLGPHPARAKVLAFNKQWRFYIPNCSFTVRYKYGNITKDDFSADPCDQYYIKNVDQLINVGYQATQNKDIIIKFLNNGTYTFNNLDIYAVHMDSYLTQVKKLRQNGLKNVTYSNNFIKGSVTLDKQGLLYMSIPYSKGWKAYVNGKNVEVLPADTMFCAIPLNKGLNNIEFRYVSPYLIIGLIISIIAIIIFILLIIISTYISKKSKKNKYFKENQSTELI